MIQEMASPASIPGLWEYVMGCKGGSRRSKKLYSKTMLMSRAMLVVEVNAYLEVRCYGV